VPSAFDCLGKQALVVWADSADSPGQYFPSFGNKMAEKLSILKINIGDFFRAEFTNSLAPNAEAPWTWHSQLAFLP
jgi:hypothetical protein